MGSDAFPEPEVLGAIQAAREFGWHIILTGNKTQLLEALTRAVGPRLPANITIEHAPERVTSGEQPAFASR
ncbi:MAG: phosphate--acyl-ACP acyltransferase, partial [Chloroflexi bacterium]|nr:phosphate--acyl-ACP acyltransferase [Chloroflexota bacterium]